MQSTALERLRVIESERIDSIRFDSIHGVRETCTSRKRRKEGGNEPNEEPNGRGHCSRDERHRTDPVVTGSERDGFRTKDEY